MNNKNLLDKLQTKLGLSGKHSIIQILNGAIPLSINNLVNILTNYVVSEKADGERCLLYYDEEGNIFPIFKAFNKKSAIGRSSKYKNCILDSEYIKEIGKYLVFDILIMNNENITAKLFHERYSYLDKLTKGSKILVKKKFHFPTATTDIFILSKRVYYKKYPYHIDGLIFNPINQGYHESIIYKWKPVDELTIDFLIRDKRIMNNNKEVYLFVNVSNILFKKNRFFINDQYMKLFPFIDVEKDTNFPFYFLKSPLAIVPNNIPDNVIIEFSYDIKKNDEISRWKLYKIREDKTRDYLKNFKLGKYNGEMGPNGWMTATKHLEIIKNPVTKEMIFGEVPIPKKYYNTQAKNVEGDINVYKYNNFVKSYLYGKYLKEGDNLLEIAGGRGGDMRKILDKNPYYVLFTNINKNALKEAERRYKNMAGKIKIDFLQVDFLNTEANKKISKMIDGDLFDIISCQFAFHYFLINNSTIANLKKLVDQSLRKGGLFMLTGYDGEKIYDLLKDKVIINFKRDYKIIAEIEKLYENDHFKNYGQKINVFIEKIGIKHEEYLINFDYIIEVFNNYIIVEDGSFAMIDGFNKTKLSVGEIEYIGLHRFIILQKR